MRLFSSYNTLYVMAHSIGDHSITIESPRISVARRITCEGSSAKVVKTIARRERMNILYIRKKLLPPHSTLFMFSHQTKNKQNAGFTLVEVMVVILIITMLLILGNYSDFSLRREKARLEELTVQLISMIDQEKTNSLLGKTESSAIIRKRKITIDYADPDITYNSFADLAEDTENSYCGTP